MSMCAHVHDRNGMVNYKPGEHTREMLFIAVSNIGHSEEKNY